MNYSKFFLPQNLQDHGIICTQIGVLNLPTGKLVAADPLVNPERDAFTRTLPKGEYPVYIYYTDNNAIGIAELRISEAPAVEWEMGILPDDKMEDLGEGEYFGFPVDTGLACFMDELSSDFFCAIQDEVQSRMGDDFISYYDNVLADELIKNNDMWCDHRPSPDSTLNVIIFDSSWGDNVFGCYFGLDAAGNVAKVIVDLNIFEEDMGVELS